VVYKIGWLIKTMGLRSPSSGALAIARYLVFLGASPSSMSQVATALNTSYKDSSVNSGTTYYYAREASFCAELARGRPLQVASIENSLLVPVENSSAAGGWWFTKSAGSSRRWASGRSGCGPKSG
jgi:hypothetical protein